MCINKSTYWYTTYSLEDLKIYNHNNYVVKHVYIYASALLNCIDTLHDSILYLHHLQCCSMQTLWSELQHKPFLPGHSYSSTHLNVPFSPEPQLDTLPAGCSSFCTVPRSAQLRSYTQWQDPRRSRHYRIKTHYLTVGMGWGFAVKETLAKQNRCDVCPCSIPTSWWRRVLICPCTPLVFTCGQIDTSIMLRVHATIAIRSPSSITSVSPACTCSSD